MNFYEVLRHDKDANWETRAARSGILSMLQLGSACAARLLTTVVGAPKGGDPKELLLGQFVPLTILVARPT